MNIKNNTKTILIIEDHPINSKMLFEMLKRKEYNVITAQNNNEAEKLFEKNQIDLILINIQLTADDSFFVVENIRKKYNKNIIIIALTPFASEELKNKSSSIGIDDHLVKPIRPKILYELIDKYFYKEYITNDLNSESGFSFTCFIKEAGITESFGKQILEMFLERYPKEIDDILKSLNDKDIEKIKKLSHKFKGQLFNLSMDKAASYFALIETENENNFEKLKYYFSEGLKLLEQNIKILKRIL